MFPLKISYSITSKNVSGFHTVIQEDAPGGTGAFSETENNPIGRIQELQRMVINLESKNQSLQNERDYLSTELTNMKATQSGGGGDGSDNEGVGEISSDAARKRLFRLVKRAADGPLALSCEIQKIMMVFV